MNSPTDKPQIDAALNCQAIEERVHELLDQRQSPLEDALVAEHCNDCRHCSKLVTDFGAITDSLLRQPLSPLPTEIQQRTLNFKAISLVASISALLLVMLTSNAWLPNANAPGETSSVASAVVTPSTVAPTIGSANFGVDAMAAISQPILEFDLLTFAKRTLSSQQLLNKVGIEQIGSQVEPYHEYLGVTSELPGIESFSDSVNLALEFLTTISRTAQEKSLDSLPGGVNVGWGDHGNHIETSLRQLA